MIPVNEPFIGQREIEYVTECLRTGWISSAGRFIEEFEEKWAAYCGMKYGAAVSNGTAALQVAVGCIGLKPGDEVIMPTFTIISCAQAVIYNGGMPVLVDCEPRTWCMDVSRIEAKITPKTKAVMPVHIYGHPVDMDPLLDLARKYKLTVIEDAAEAHGAEYKGRKCGGIGDISCFSFYANKLITTGEGGMVVTNDQIVAEKARSLRNLCFRPEKRFLHTELGHNFRLTNIQAALGLAQLERVEEIIAKKRWMGKAYTERLQDIPGLQLPVEEPWAKHVYWMYGIVLDENIGMDAVEFSKWLKEHGIETRPFFLGMHEQPVFLNRGLFMGEHYPLAERIGRQGFYLPSGLTLTESQIDQVCQSIRKIILR
ncbi:MAG: DegT/DnrJ/EryC1/StrS family aminotransferase [Thermodesulfobacteriota bacterium]